mmetsp:Transcript_3964/g.11887  ORF Transcript_3964/g.11887 Transcript_3964/m.11887 type:complete len:177 (-) Transcript_3964:1193-1723(-)
MMAFVGSSAAGCTRCRADIGRREPRRKRAAVVARARSDGNGGDQEDAPTFDRREFLSLAAAAGAGLGLPHAADARFLGEIFKGEGKDVFQRTSFIYDVSLEGLNELVGAHPWASPPPKKLHSAALSRSWSLMKDACRACRASTMPCSVWRATTSSSSVITETVWPITCSQQGSLGN